MLMPHSILQKWSKNCHFWPFVWVFRICVSRTWGDISPFGKPPGDSGKARVEDMQMLYNQLTHARHPPGLLLVTSSSGQNATRDGNLGARNLGNLFPFGAWDIKYHHINKT